MAKKFTKTIKAFKETGLYNPETQIITGSKDGEETNILEILELLSRNGQELTISAKVEDTIEDIEE